MAVEKEGTGSSAREVHVVHTLAPRTRWVLDIEIDSSSNSTSAQRQTAAVGSKDKQR